jgi:hypothetical protein
MIIQEIFVKVVYNPIFDKEQAQSTEAHKQNIPRNN